jgi:cytochrome P450
LPYVEATLNEVLRINPIAPLTPHHRVLKDTKLNGYDIPKVNIILIVLITDEREFLSYDFYGAKV